MLKVTIGVALLLVIDLFGYRRIFTRLRFPIGARLNLSHRYGVILVGIALSATRSLLSLFPRCSTSAAFPVEVLIVVDHSVDGVQELPHHREDGLELGLPARHSILVEGSDVGIVASGD